MNCSCVRAVKWRRAVELELVLRRHDGTEQAQRNRHPLLGPACSACENCGSLQLFAVAAQLSVAIGMVCKSCGLVPSAVAVRASGFHVVFYWEVCASRAWPAPFSAKSCAPSAEFISRSLALCVARWLWPASRDSRCKGLGRGGGGLQVADVCPSGFERVPLLFHSTKRGRKVRGFHESSTKVPRRFHEGSGKVPGRFREGSGKVPGRFPGCMCCWLYHLSFYFSQLPHQKRRSFNPQRSSHLGECESETWP